MLDSASLKRIALMVVGGVITFYIVDYLQSRKDV